MASETRTRIGDAGFQTAVLPTALAGLAAVAFGVAATALALWQPGQPGNYSGLVQQKFAPLPGTTGAEATPLDEADRALRHGNALLSARDSAGAIHEFGRAVALQPAYALAWVNMGVAHYNLNRPKEARDAFLRGYTLDPYNFLAARNLALLNDIEGRLLEARDFYQQAARLDPKNAEIAKRLTSLKSRDR